MWTARQCSAVGTSKSSIFNKPKKGGRVMLNNINIHIDEVDTTYFDDFDKKYKVDVWWHEDNDNDNIDYSMDEPNERGGVVASISEDGENVEWVYNFNEAITEDNDNAWVLEEIEDAQRRIKENYYKNN